MSLPIFLSEIFLSSSPSGNIRFAGESEDSHRDRFWAKALRQHALSTNQGGIGAMVGWW